MDQIVSRAHSPGAAAFQTLADVASELDLTGLGNVLASYPGLLTPSVIEGFPLGRVLELENVAGHSPFPPVHRLVSYYVVDPRASLGIAASNRLLADLQKPSLRNDVDRVYREPELREAHAWAVTTDDTRVNRQGYLRGGVSGADAYQGINVNNIAVWGTYDGSGIGFVDLERGWNLNHEDLLAPIHGVYNTNVYNPSIPATGDHGTAVLGVVLGQDNTLGILGIAPKAKLLRIVSRVKSSANEWDVVGSILAAVEFMDPGDVLLIEVETVATTQVVPRTPPTGYPVEIVDHWFDAIRLAVGNGMVVVEAAGNGVPNNPRNLDQLEADWADAPLWRSLDRNKALFLDSGAIMVSACSSAVSPAAAHRRIDYATHGTRIDCYAWGENVYTTGYGYADLPLPANADVWYADDFGGTSAASAIIAGASILLQQMHLAARGSRLSPVQLRALLSDWTTGVKIAGPIGTQQIGVMPDLERIVPKIPTIPDVYVRDSVTDDGAVPNAMVFQSPDIIIRSTPSANPDAEYGQASPLANAIPPNAPVQPNVPNYLYVRIRNRGTVAAAGVTATVYWSEASSLVAPVHWKLIGQTNPVDVPAGRILSVAGPLVWTPAPGALPASHHGCFVAVIGHPLDPPPPLLPTADPVTGATTTWDMFLAYVGRNNNVAWRNFSVLQPTGTGGAEVLFFLRGAGDRARAFTIELINQLGDKARLWWEVPAELADIMRDSPTFAIKEEEKTGKTVRFSLPAGGNLRLKDIKLEGLANYRCALQVELPRARPSKDALVVLRQIFQKIEVGRLTWVIPGRERSIE